jgi:PRTRC genetic system ThiF family protein
MTTLTFDPHLHLDHIVIVGAGGTGAQVARSVARILYDARSRRIHTPHLTIIDPDVVSPANIGRQLFAPNHVNLPKSTVLAQRLGLALGLEITAVTAPFHPRHMPTSYGSSTVVIACVDNHEARSAIHDYSCAALIDLGNHRTRGQCVIGNQPTNSPSYFNPDRQNVIRYLPHPYRVFPQLLEPEPETAADATLSCAQLVEQSTQHLLINDLMSLTAANYVYRLIHRQPITHWLSFADIDEISLRHVPINLQTIGHYGRILFETQKTA